MRIGLPELVVILIIALIIFGPKGLPKLGATLGKTIKNFRDGMDGQESGHDDVKTVDSNVSEKQESISASDTQADK